MRGLTASALESWEGLSRTSTTRATRPCDGAAALEMAAAYRPDVLLLDISMPKMDGCQLAKQLRRQTRFTETLLIAITGWADNAHRVLGKEAGFDHFLSKPVELSILEELLLLQQDRLAESPEVRLLAPWK